MRCRLFRFRAAGVPFNVAHVGGGNAESGGAPEALGRFRETLSSQGREHVFQGHRGPRTCRITAAL